MQKKYLKNKITETKNLMAKCTNDKKYYALESQLEFLNKQL